MYTIKVRMRKLGKKNQGAVEPVEFLLESRPETVKELVEGLVCLGVRQYNERKDTGQIVPWLTSETIQEQAVTGKISFGLRGGNDADADQAVENAVQCFEDGIYRIFADDEELTELGEAVARWTCIYLCTADDAGRMVKGGNVWEDLPTKRERS